MFFWVRLGCVNPSKRAHATQEPVFLPFPVKFYVWKTVQELTKKKVGPRLVNFVPPVAYHFCLALPAAFTQPGERLLARKLYLAVAYPPSNLLTECYGVPSLACNLMTIRTWRGSDWNGAPFMHSMHCFFALGLFISPLLSKPFLTGRERHPGMGATHEKLKTSTYSIFRQGKGFIFHCKVSRGAS